MKSRKPPTKTKEDNVRITVDIPESLYIKMKIAVAEKRTTIRQFFIDFLNKELEKEPV